MTKENLSSSLTVPVVEIEGRVQLGFGFVMKGNPNI